MNRIIVDSNDINIVNSGSYLVDCNDDIKDITINVLDGISVNIYLICKDVDVKRNVIYNIEQDSCVYVYKFYNVASSLENIIVNLNGYSSSINYYFSGISNNREEYNMTINHNNKKVISRVYNHFVALDNGEIKFRIDSNVSNGNSGCIMDQQTKIINFGDNKSVIMPNMNVDEFDVVAKHGSVIGRFRDEDIFYLMSRGISYNDSIILLIKGFLLKYFDEVIIKDINDIIFKYWR